MAERRITNAERGGRWDDLAQELRDPAGPVIVEGDNDDFVVISLDRYKDLVEQEEQLHIARAREAWVAIQQRDGNRNADLTESEIDQLANRFAEEFVEELVAEGKLRYADE